MRNRLQDKSHHRGADSPNWGQLGLFRFNGQGVIPYNKAIYKCNECGHEQCIPSPIETNFNEPITAGRLHAGMVG
jgi:hypothetical protein